jgi:hypothetical protein
VSTTAIPDRFTTLPDEPALQTTVVALEEHGFSVEVVGDLDAARQAVLARIPEGSSVMTNASVTLDQTGIADAINDAAGRWESARNTMFALDFATQAQQMKAIGGQPDYALGSVHAITRDGTLVIASASGSQGLCRGGGADPPGCRQRPGLGPGARHADPVHRRRRPPRRLRSARAAGRAGNSRSGVSFLSSSRSRPNASISARTP